MIEVAKPVVSKTLVKGTIVLAVFSLFLQINARNLPNFLYFVVLYYLFLASYMFQKHANTYTLTQEKIEMKSLFRAPRAVDYADVESVSISQGFFAKRFNCGTLFLNLRHTGGRVRIMGGGSAEALKDVSDPIRLQGEIEKRISSLEMGS